MSWSSPPPEDYLFLEDIGGQIRLSGDSGTTLDGLEVSLVYTAEQSSTVEFDNESATIELDIRFIESIVDFVSCMRLSDPRASGARALLVVYNLALDLALSRGDDALVIGLLQDYIVTRTTAEFEVAHVMDPEVDLSGNALKTVAEIAAMYVVLHEFSHWQIARDSGFVSKCSILFQSLMKQLWRNT